MYLLSVFFVDIIGAIKKKWGGSMAEKKNSEARIKANNRYNEKAYDRINIAVPKGKKSIIAEKTVASGEGINAFVNRAIDMLLQQ